MKKCLKTRQIIKHTGAIQKEPTISRDRSGDYDMLFSFREKPVSEAYLQSLAVALIDWARDNNNALILGQFLASRTIGWDNWHNWIKRSEVLLEAHNYAKMCIGIRRELGGLKRKLDSAMIMRSMPHYSKDWQSLNEWYAKIKEDSNSQGTNITVRMDPIPGVEIPRVEKKRDE